MVRMSAGVALAIVAFPTALCHPGESTEAMKRETAMRNEQHAVASRALSKCQDSPRAAALRERAAERRAVKVAKIRQERELTTTHQERDLASLKEWAAQDHNRTSQGYDLDTPANTLFGSNNTCALVPETTIGPYFVTGEYIRGDITEGQAGVPLHLDMQFVDINTCEPTPFVLADVWHCNSTGVYAGIDSQGGLDSTWLRGVQLADEDGVTQFDTIFPGHYTDRLTHVHVVTQSEYTVHANGTYSGGTTRHIGQLYFDDALVKAVEANAPYNTNTIAWTELEEDDFAPDEATADNDPFVEYVQLGDDVRDGLLGWITIGVDMSSNHNSNLTVAASYYEGGGVSNPNATFPGPPPTN